MLPLAPLLLALATEPQPLTSKQELLVRKLEAQVAQVDRELDAVLGVAILDFASGREVLLNADEVFPAASVIKLPLLVELFRQEQQAAAGATGRTRLADVYTPDPRDLVDDSRILAGLTPGTTRVTNRDLALFVAAVSDNAAANVLIDRVGMVNVNAMLDGLGLTQSRLRRKMMDLAAAREGRENVGTPRELVRLLEAVHGGRVLAAPLSEDLLRLLRTPKKSFIPTLLPEDVPVANKDGELEGVRADVGIVYATGRPFAIAVMATYAGDERAAEQAISRIARAAYACFDRLGRGSPSGRVISPRNSKP